MTKTKSTKRALVLSLLSLVLCVSMLVGSTFAWFTDSVTSAGNKIQAGTLDIVMEYWDGTEWVDAEGKMLEFVKADTSAGTEVLWEPGCTYQLPKFRIRNVGNLAAKILIKLNGVTGDEKLLEAIELTTTISNMPESILNGSAAGQLAQFNNATVPVMYGTPDGTLVFDWSLMGKGDVSPNTGHTDTTPEFTVAGHMKEEAGNEYQGLAIEGVCFTVVATQEVSEYDSFTREYDKNATFPTVNAVSNEADLVAALDAGKDVTLTTDIATTATKIAPYGNKVGFVHNGGVFNGGGNTIGIDNGGDNYAVMTKGGTITNLNIDNGFRGIVIMYATEDIIIDNVNVGGEGVCYPLNTAEYGDPNAKLVVTNSTLAGWTSFAGIKSASFTNVNFEQGQYYTNLYGRLVKPYVETVFENCDFSDEYYIDLSALSADAKVTLKNCTVNGVSLTASNWTSLIVPESECGAGQISIEARNGSYMSASNVLDYVIIQ